LIVRTDRIGDLVLTTPAIKALRQAYPMARISILVKPSTKDLVLGNPYLDEVLVDDCAGRHHGFLGYLRLAREIRQRKFDIAFVFHTKRRFNFACYLAGIPKRVGYKNDKFGIFLTHTIKDTRCQGHKHEAQYCLDLLNAMQIEAKELDLFVPINKEAEQWAGQWFEDQGISAGDVIAIHAGSSDKAKCWAPERFAQLIDSLQHRYVSKVILIGGSETVHCSDRIMGLTTQKPLNLTGKTTLAQTVSLLRRCRLLISNDSGPIHIAAAVGIHVISIFLRNQPGINPQRWKPLSDKGMYIFSENGIEVQDVLENVENVLAKSEQKFFHW
jgi:heptosyltransferase-2